MINKKYQTVDEYFKDLPEEKLPFLDLIRKTIRDAIPEAEEVISYNMPAYKFNGMLVYFAAYPNHIGFYPTASGIAAFKDQLQGFKHAKGSVQFRYDQELPIKLIAGMAKFRWKENSRKQA